MRANGTFLLRKHRTISVNLLFRILTFFGSQLETDIHFLHLHYWFHTKPKEFFVNRMNSGSGTSGRSLFRDKEIMYKNNIMLNYRIETKDPFGFHLE